MFKKYFFILNVIFHVEGDLIKIEIESNRRNICPKPKLYRSDLSGLTADNIDEKLYCIPYEDKTSFYKAPEILRLKIKPNSNLKREMDKSDDVPNYEDDFGGIYTLDEDFDRKATVCTNQRNLENSYWYCLHTT